MIKDLLRKASFITVPLARVIFSLFFDSNYLKGRWFEQRYTGYKWAVKSIVQNNILRLGRPMPWPTGLTCYVSSPHNLVFHPDDLNNFQSPGTYFQNSKRKITIGRGSYIAPNVGIITVNHLFDNLDEHEEGRDVVIGEKCWIGMNAVILPGVLLGAGTIVAAGSVVTKSFPEGRQVIGGTPAHVLKKL